MKNKMLIDKFNQEGENSYIENITPMRKITADTNKWKDISYS